MKTKNIVAILAMLTVVAGVVGCKSDDETMAKPAKERLRVLGGDIEIRSSDETTTVTVSADCHWRVMNLDAGDFGSSLTIQPREGLGDGILVVGTDQNTTKIDRTATFTLVSDGGLQQRVTIRQTGSGDGMNLSKGAFTFGAVPEGAQLLTITSNTNWTIQTPAGISWLHLDKTTGSSGAEVVQISVDNAVTDIPRAVTLAVIYGSKSVEFTVTQEGITDEIYLRASEELSRFDSHGGSHIIGIEGNAEWQAYIPSSCTWLHLEEGHDPMGNIRMGYGIGNGELHLRCDANNTNRDRLTAVIVVSGSRNPKQVVILVEQAANGSQQASLTVGDLTSLYVGNNYAEFRFSFVSDEEVADYGLVYSTTEQMPTRENAEVVTVGQGGFSGNVMAMLENLQESTTYYVRAYVLGTTLGCVYSPNVVTITTSASSREPGESDNPDPTLAPRW